MATLKEFTSELRTRNISKPSLYYVEIVKPPIAEKNAKEFEGTDLNLISMWCHTAMTPQSTIYTKDDHYDAGVRRKYAYDKDYQNLTLSFYVDQNFKIKQFFDQWDNAVVSNRRNFGYPDDYTADLLNLYIINQEGNTTYKYEYSRIFPKSVNSIELSYASGAPISTFTVDFVFEHVYYSVLGDTGNAQITSKPTSLVANAPTTSKQQEVATYDGGGHGEGGGDFLGAGATGSFGADYNGRF